MMFSREEYMSVQDHVTSYPGLTNVITNDTWHSQHKVLFEEKESENRQDCMVHPKQRSGVFMKNQLQKWFNLAQLVWD